MNRFTKDMLEKQATQDRLERAGDTDISEHAYTRVIEYVESFELLTLELSMAIDTDDHEDIKRCQSEMITLCTVNNYNRC